MARSAVLGLSLCALFAVLLVGTGPAWAAPRVVADAPGDAVNQDDDSPLDVPEADILSAAIDSSGEGIILNVRVRRPTAPAPKSAWDGSTEIEWELDTTGDGEADFVADYSTDDPGTRIVGDVRPATDKEDQHPLCSIKSGAYSPEDGYTAVVDPSCIGNPKTVAFSVTFSYDTDPANDGAAVAEDDAPDNNFSLAITLAAPAAAGPQTAAPVGSPTAGSPPSTSGTPHGGMPAVGAPAVGVASERATTEERGGVRTRSAIPPVGQPSPSTGAAAGAVPAAPTGGGLAKTGAASDLLLRIGAVAMTLGGMCLMAGATGPAPRGAPHRRRPQW